jgi:hypothetical protein
LWVLNFYFLFFHADLLQEWQIIEIKKKIIFFIKQYIFISGKKTQHNITSHTNSNNKNTKFKEIDEMMKRNKKSKNKIHLFQWSNLNHEHMFVIIKITKNEEYSSIYIRFSFKKWKVKIYIIALYLKFQFSKLFN